MQKSNNTKRGGLTFAALNQALGDKRKVKRHNKETLFILKQKLYSTKIYYQN